MTTRKESERARIIINEGEKNEVETMELERKQEKAKRKTNQNCKILKRDNEE